MERRPLRIDERTVLTSPPEHKAAQRRGAATLVLVAALAAAPLFALACGSNQETKGFTGSTATGAGASGPTTGAGGGTTGAGGHGGDPIFDDAGVGSTVSISPVNPILKVELPLTGQTVQFACTDVQTGQVLAATWTLSTLDLGSISATGLFTPNGDRTGEVTVSCDANGGKAQTKLKVFIHALDNQGGLTQVQQDTLKGPPGLSDPAWQFQYPYDGTVFPRGILAPEIHLTSGTSQSNAYYVHVVLPQFEYEGFFNNSPSNTQLQMSQDAWEAMGNAAKGATVEVQISKLFNGQKYGPISRTWTLANGTLHGTIYYNTYDSPLAGQTGAIMRIKGNSPTPEVLLGNCVVCHSVAADGSTVASASGIYDLTGGMLNPPNVWSDGTAAFGALFPKNGSVIVIQGAPGSGNTPGLGGTYPSSLRTKLGALIASSGIEATTAQSPVFSHDGKMLAFCDRPVANTSTSTLSLFDYDELTQKFSNYRVLAVPPQGHHYSWPAFTPDSKHVIFQDGVGEDLATWGSNTAKIFSVEIATKQLTFVARLNGDGYMPGGTRDENLNYEPTIAPVASGGYFWIMYTSRRTYGNKLTSDRSATKRLWVSAFDANAASGVDATHPGFYISGQELTSGNSRGFWALDPCKQDGAGCETGDECCNGFCNPTGNPPVYVCGPPDGSCSDEFEACTTKADCCDPELECIGGKCSQIPPT